MPQRKTRPKRPATRKAGKSPTPRTAGRSPAPRKAEVPIERVQLGVRMEKRLTKVLKAIAEMGDMSLGELLEEIVLHAFEGEQVFLPETRRKIQQLKSVYGLDYDVHAAHRFTEPGRSERA